VSRETYVMDRWERIAKDELSHLLREKTSTEQNRLKLGARTQRAIQARRGGLVESKAPQMAEEMQWRRAERAGDAYQAHRTAQKTQDAFLANSVKDAKKIKLPNPANYRADVKPDAIKEIKVGGGRGGKAALIGGAVGVPVAGAYLVRTNRKSRKQRA
jgi:hypothetical protein